MDGLLNRGLFQKYIRFVKKSLVRTDLHSQILSAVYECKDQWRMWSGKPRIWKTCRPTHVALTLQTAVQSFWKKAFHSFFYQVHDQILRASKTNLGVRTYTCRYWRIEAITSQPSSPALQGVQNQILEYTWGYVAYGITPRSVRDSTYVSRRGGGGGTWPRWKSGLRSADGSWRRKGKILL